MFVLLFRHSIEFSSTHNRILLRMRGLIWINIRHPMLAIWESLKPLRLFRDHCYISNHKPLSATLKSRLLRQSFHCHFTFNLGSIVALPKNLFSNVSIAICWSYFLTIMLSWTEKHRTQWLLINLTIVPMIISLSMNIRSAQVAASTLTTFFPVLKLVRLSLLRTCKYCVRGITLVNQLRSFRHNT